MKIRLMCDSTVSGGEEQPLADGLVRAPFGHQRQYLTFTVGEVVEGMTPAFAARSSDLHGGMTEQQAELIAAPLICYTARRVFGHQNPGKRRA